MRGDWSIRIACIFDNLRDYRIPLFERLAKLYPDMDFIITDQRDASIKPCNVLQNCKVLSHSKIRLVLSEEIPLGLIPKLINGRYDLVFCWKELTWACIISLLISKLMRKKFMVHSEAWCYPRNAFGLVASAITTRIARSCDAIVVPGSKAKEFFAGRFKADEKKIFLAPYAAFLFNRDSGNCKSRQMRAKEELEKTGKKVILYLSRIIPLKGLDYLLKAFSRLERERDDVFLVIGGAGESAPRAQELRALLKLQNVEFIGPVIDPTEKRALYDLCNVFVLPSVSMPYSAPCNEAWGLVVNEAMSMGKPVITTTAVGAADDLVINGVNGIVVEEKSVDDLCDALRKILADDEMRSRMGLIAKETVYTKFSYDREIEGIMNAIDHCGLR